MTLECAKDLCNNFQLHLAFVTLSSGLIIIKDNMIFYSALTYLAYHYRIEFERAKVIPKSQKQLVAICFSKLISNCLYRQNLAYLNGYNKFSMKIDYRLNKSC
ncbi:GNAT family N-acetyltransferase [Gilliamella sp. ESL0441]|uniref:GNAT family N-acetyltransferase n=1 Tax=Gilliamella sp. ESL0441 TaxID=2704654 RepID=UPI00351D326D